MKPVVSTGKAYFCTVLSIFGVVILSVIGYLFQINHESMMGAINDPENDGVPQVGSLAEVAEYLLGVDRVQIDGAVDCVNNLVILKAGSTEVFLDDLGGWKIVHADDIASAVQIRASESGRGNSLQNVHSVDGFGNSAQSSNLENSLPKLQSDQRAELLDVS